MRRDLPSPLLGIHDNTAVTLQERFLRDRLSAWRGRSVADPTTASRTDERQAISGYELSDYAGSTRRAHAEQPRDVVTGHLGMLIKERSYQLPVLLDRPAGWVNDPGRKHFSGTVGQPE